MANFETNCALLVIICHLSAVWNNNMLVNHNIEM